MGEHRVVVLAGDNGLNLPGPESLGVDLEYVYVNNGYEAAAELLVDSPLALVIDLPCLTVKHRKLLYVAREVGTEVLGLGSFPAGLSAEDLSGMRLISLSDLTGLLKAAAEKADSRASDNGSVRLAPAKPAEFRPESAQQQPADSNAGAEQGSDSY
jgi:hypothetical protein